MHPSATRTSIGAVVILVALPQVLDISPHGLAGGRRLGFILFLWVRLCPDSSVRYGQLFCVALFLWVYIFHRIGTSLLLSHERRMESGQGYHESGRFGWSSLTLSSTGLARHGIHYFCVLRHGWSTSEGVLSSSNRCSRSECFDDAQ
ncbi:hypothetical protein CPAR01_05018 [Colletotrichum paranaense]|uniref:Secreted peptide n=1 Tax=Colletotrichum paranaense TaxID=1914294 RepID=A0ABQ9SQ49_9PEZI|nr:uncharacterized protein CPAR01_05018 [Colletotrichum paranaense]KAK1541631.1 hypothetical protein CPAR01_05018 [Colletotrichum paranaense]